MLTEPRRPILTVSPSRSTEVGSPIRIMSGRMPRSSSQSMIRGVPKVAGPSSSPVMRKQSVPRSLLDPRHGGDEGGDRALHVVGAAADQHGRPRSARANGSLAQPSPGGTTSRWPAKPKCGRACAADRDHILDRAVGRLAHHEAVDVEAERQQAPPRARRTPRRWPG